MLEGSRPPPAPPGERAGAPVIWVLTSDKLGDNAQVQIIAEALELPFQNKRLRMQQPYMLGKPRFRPSLYHIDVAGSDPLAPPWPDLVLTIGRRLAMVALWIREQSGGRTRLALVGRPRMWLDRFDLVVATAQYRLPERPNVLHLQFPLMRVDEPAIAAAAASWAPRIAHLPRPLTTLLVGGPTLPFSFDATTARRLVDMASRSCREAGGTLYVTTSRRTPAVVVDTIQRCLPQEAVLYRWTPQAADNPYRGLLALSDRFIVTGDSVSMMVEVARLGKPLAIFPLPRRSGLLERVRIALGDLVHPPSGDAPGSRGGPLQPLGELLYKAGILGYSRDLTAIHRLLIAKGAAVRLGDPFPPGGCRIEDELPRVVARVRTLIAA